jgi:hypothetical protein
MAGSASDLLENSTLNHILGGPNYTRPSTVYIGLWISPLAGGSTGNENGEVSGGSYVRVAVPNDPSHFPAASCSQKSNAQEIVFPVASNDWGIVSYWAILDAETAGNIMFFGTLATSRNVVSGDQFKFPVGGIIIKAA